VEPLLPAFGFFFGALIGSFLNVCIYRIPRGISLIHPPRSFCPHCQSTIPWRENIPILSWLLLRGRCAHCHAPIRPRYVIVEAITALLFSASAFLVPLPTLFSVWVILSILVVTTFVDLEFFIIPDAMSKGGIVAGLLLSLLTPGLHKTPSPLIAVVLSLSGALVGALILFLISELGKVAFGRYKVTLEVPTRFTFEVLPPEDRRILIDDEPFLWSEHFFRDSDRIIVHANEVKINGAAYQNIDLTFFHDRLLVVGETIPLDQIADLSGRTASAQFPREAMGLGDVKLIAAIGTFAGWQGILFTIAVASFLGAAFGLTAIALGKRERSAKIPFGPYLAMAAVIWLFWGDALLSLYLGSMFRW
jgi:leader peptidase (prepilin peptidase) / N-methyltransferase